MTANTFNGLCDVCRRVIDTLREVDWHTDLEHHRSYETLQQADREGCGVCVFLHGHLSSPSFQGIPNLWNNVFPLYCESDTSSATWQNSFELTFTSTEVETLSLTFTMEAIDDAAGNQTTYIPTSSTNSPESWKLIGQWMKQCTEKHERCNAAIAEAWTPTRLLDIGASDNGMVRLVTSQDKTFLPKEPYATLSHCWGVSQVFKTTMSNILELTTGFLPHVLSRTFQEAISVARSFNIRYLWIDSLCIVQDSKEDWAHEADIMSKVYRYAFINIAATGSSEGNQGCFWERDPQHIRPTVFNIKWSNSIARRYLVVPDADLWAQQLISQPLNRRGWVLQERILSPRIIHFGNVQLFWECREFVACETYPHGLPSSLKGNTIIDIKTLDLGDEPQDDRWPAKFVAKNEEPGKTMLRRLWAIIQQSWKPVIVQEITLHSARKAASVYRDWDAVVELYSLGALSYPRDKLVALSGITSTIVIGEQNAIGDGYLAGLWQSSLPSHLLWTTEFTERSPTRKSKFIDNWVESYATEGSKVAMPQRYREYIAPSWSWASIDGRISFKWCQHNYDSKDYLANLETAEVQWARIAARFGQVESGFLKMSGPLASVYWEGDSSPALEGRSAGKITHIFPKSFNPRTAVYIPSENAATADILFDTNDEHVQSRELTLFAIIGVPKRIAHEEEAVLGLVLRQESRSEEYQRIGFFYTVRPRAARILRHMPRQTIVII